MSDLEFWVIAVIASLGTFAAVFIPGWRALKKDTIEGLKSGRIRPRPGCPEKYLRIYYKYAPRE